MNLLNDIIYLLSNYHELLIEGLINTMIVALFGTIGGLFIGMLILVMRMQKVNDYDNKLTIIFKKIATAFATAYVDVLRGTPMIVQAMIFYHGIAAHIGMSVMWAALIVVSLNTAAYISEIIRSGVNALGNGAFEAGHTLGMTRFQILRYVIYPQVIKNSLPALLNELIVNVKDSSVLSVIGFTDLFYSAKGAASESYLTFQAFILIAIIYLILTIVLTRLIAYISNKSFSPSCNVQPIATANVKGANA